MNGQRRLSRSLPRHSRVATMRSYTESPQHYAFEIRRDRAGHKADAGARRRRRRCFCVEGLESRRLLSMIAWNTSVAPTGGDWNAGSNWVGGKVPGPNDAAVITGLRSPGVALLNSQGPVSVAGLSTDSTTTLNVMTGSLNLALRQIRRWAAQSTSCRVPP